MKKLLFSYIERKNEIKSMYDKNKKISLENIQDINDKIIDNYLDKSGLKNPLEEFYIIVSMCIHMIDNNLYDEYFFDSYKELLEDYDSGLYDEYFFNVNEDKHLLDIDTQIINEYLNNDNAKMIYYDKLSEIYDKKGINN